MIKNILYIFPELNYGGAEKSAFLISDRLHENYNFNVYFYFIKDSTDIIEKKSNFFFYKNLNIATQKIKIFRLISLLNQINRLRKKNNIDVLISGYEYESEFVIILLQILFRCRSVATVSVLQASLIGRIMDAGNINKLLFRIINQVRNTFFDGIIYVNEFIKSEFKSTKFRGLLACIPNPLDDSLLDFIQSNKMSKSDYLHPDDEPYLLCVSRVASQKNLLLLLEAFNLIKNDISFNLKIIGNISDSSYYNKLMQYIIQNDLNSRVIILPPGNGIYQLISHSVLCVFSSLYEGFPLSILEAMFLKKPIVSTKFKGYENILSHTNSFICNTFKKKDFAETILSALEQKDTIDEKLNDAHCFSKNYFATYIAMKYSDFFNGLRHT